ncbi:MAG: MobA/MobL family protein [Gammaproteobacteria bacterium]
MVIYHFSGTVISKSQVRSDVACAPYRFAERFLDQRYRKEHDYTKKNDVFYTSMILSKLVCKMFL